MGELAEDMVDGTACQWCGQYFQDDKDPEYVYTHGYPVVCKECYDEDPKAAKKAGLQRASKNTL